MVVNLISLVLILMGIVGSFIIRRHAYPYNDTEASRLGDPPRTRPGVLVIIPAHNEEGVIYQTCKSVMNSEYLYKCVVIADRCTDSTAETARAAGAEVWERTEGPGGKQQALRWAFERVPDDVEYILILDAGDILSAAALPAVARALERYDACQLRITAKNFSSCQAAWYALMHAWTASWQGVRSRLGRNAILGGSGVGLRKSTLRKVPWRVQSLVDDLEYSAMLVNAGLRIGYIPDAVVFNEVPDRLSNGYRQRLRWARGGWQILRLFPRTLLRDPEFSLWLLLPLWGLYWAVRFIAFFTQMTVFDVLLSVLVATLAGIIQGIPCRPLLRAASYVPFAWMQCALINIWSLCTAGSMHWYRTEHGFSR